MAGLLRLVCAIPPPNRTCDFHRIRLSIRWVKPRSGTWAFLPSQSGSYIPFSVAGESDELPKFAKVASSYRLRSCIYAWLGSLPRSSSEDAGQREYGIPALTGLSLQLEDRESDDSTLALP